MMKKFCPAVLGCAILFGAGMAAGHLWGAEPEGEVGASEETGSGRIPIPVPGTHRGDWIRYHGSFVPLNVNEGGQRGRACYACHDRGDCVECHSTRPPRDHNNFWRTRSHGLEAAGNRQRCLECHRQDYCVRCHNETAPRTHTGSWASRHCQWCHFGSGLAPADNCAVCHRIAPHTSAPHAVSPGLDCFQSTCHP